MINKSFIKAVLSCFLLYIMIINSTVIIQGVKNGLILCYNNVIPSLYIFMVFSNYISQSGFVSYFSIPFKWYSHLMKIKDDSFPAYLFLSLIGGFAVGANFLKKLENNGYSNNCLRVISVSMINNSLSFCALAVGAGMLKSVHTGLLLYTSLTLSSLITAFVFSFVFKYNIVLSNKNYQATSNNFVVSINNSIQSILSICGFVIIFNTICEVVSLYTHNKTFFTIFLSVFLEVTVGCIKTAEIDTILVCICLSILPLSSLCQVYYFTGNISIIKTLIISRLIHTPLSVLIYSNLQRLFPVSVVTAAYDRVIIKSYSHNFSLSATMFMLSVVFIVLTENNKLFTKNKF